MKLTQWHDGKVKPVHKGIYERNTFNGKPKSYSYFDGNFWRPYAHTIGAALTNSKCNWISSYQDSRWRGLAIKPRSKK